MPEVKEKDIYRALLKFKGEKEFKIGKAKINLSLIPEDIHKFDRPDSLLWIDISLRLFEQNLKLKVPVPIECEKHGIDGAIEDLEEFIRRGKYPIEIPMLVIAEAGYGKREERRAFPVKFMITQTPVRRLKE
jgi:hypothetical protein